MTIDEYRALYAALGLEPMRGGFITSTACCPLTARTMGVLGTKPTDYLYPMYRGLQEDIRQALGVNKEYVAGFVTGLDVPELGSKISNAQYRAGYQDGRAVRPLFGLEP